MDDFHHQCSLIIDTSHMIRYLRGERKRQFARPVLIGAGKILR